MEHAKKGHEVMVIGSLEYRQYSHKTHPDVKMQIAEIVVSGNDGQVRLLTPRPAKTKEEQEAYIPEDEVVY